MLLVLPHAPAEVALLGGTELRAAAATDGVAVAAGGVVAAAGERPHVAQRPHHRITQVLQGVDRHEAAAGPMDVRSEEHTSELQSLMRLSSAVFCLKKKIQNK